VRIYNEAANPRYHLRQPAQLIELYEGLELVEPGLVSVSMWRRTDSAVGAPVAVDQFGAVARKP